VQHRIISIITVVGVIWLIIGYVLLYHYREWGWQELEAVATWVLAMGIGIAIWQIYEGRKSTNAQTAVRIFQELRAPGAVEKLCSVYNLPYDLSTTEGINNLKDEEKKDIDYVLDRLDVLAVLVAEKIIDERLAIYAYAGVGALRCWYKLHQYIKEERKKRGYYGDNIEEFTRRSFDYFKKEGIQVRLYKKGAEDKSVDLMRELEKAELCPRSLNEIKRDRKKKESRGKAKPLKNE
jgi:hypothetical protein